MRKILIFILLLLLMSGCSNDIDPSIFDNIGDIIKDSIENNDNNACSETSETLELLSDERFNGIFVYISLVNYLNTPGIGYASLVIKTHVFDGTIKAETYYKFLKYTYADGWHYTRTPTHFIHEVKTEGNKFFIRLWDSPYFEWEEYEYSFKNGGYTLILHDYFESTGNDMTLLKQ